MKPDTTSALRAPAYRRRLALGVSRYSASDENDVMEFRRSVWGADAARCTPGCFRWQFKDCPNLPAGRPQIWICRRNGEIVGHQAGIPVSLKVGAHYYRASWAIDLVVLTQYRLRGIGAILSEKHVQDNDVTIGLGVSDQACRAYVRAGWVDLGTVPLFVRPLDAAEMLSARWRRRTGRGLGRLANVPLRLLDAASRARSPLGRFRMEEVDRFDGRVDALWESASECYPLICRRDSRSLNWRYVDCPGKDGYERFYFLRKERLIGYAVLRMGERHSAAAGNIVDYLCAPEWTGTLFAECLAFFRKRGVAAVYCLHAGPTASATLKWLGFIRRESGTRLMVRSRVSQPDAVGLLSDPRKWFVTAGDSDLDHPNREAIGAANDGWQERGEAR